MTEPTDAGPNPCPFCGSSNIVHYEVEGRANHSFECCECLAASMCKTTHQEALAAWNRRSPQPTQAQAWPPKSWIDEVRGYLTAAADSSMSRNNSEQLASELLEQMPTQAQAGAVPLTDREIELIDGMIQVQLDHASRCDAIANRSMADKQKGWDMERVALLQKIKAHGIKGGQHE